MSPLRTFVDGPVAGAVGWTLFHPLWEGAVIQLRVQPSSPRCLPPACAPADACGSARGTTSGTHNASTASPRNSGSHSPVIRSD